MLCELTLLDGPEFVSQDVLAIAAAREFGVYPYDLIMESKSSQVSISVPASTPRIPDSPIKDACKRICISDECSDHADSLYSYFNSKNWLLGLPQARRSSSFLVAIADSDKQSALLLLLHDPLENLSLSSLQAGIYTI